MLNSPLPSWPEILCQNEAWCTTIHMKMSLICMRMESHFHIKEGENKKTRYEQEDEGNSEVASLSCLFIETNIWPHFNCNHRY